MIEDTEKVRIVNSRFRIELLHLGASMHRFEVRMDDGSWRNIILGASRIEDYLTTNSYMGMTVGRFANRIREARFALDGVTYQLDANEGANHAHGGANGFHARRWSLTGQGSDWARFELRSADGDQGFPGAVGVSAHYQLLPDGASVTYEATSDAPTIVNLTTHPYFNLDGEGVGDCDSHELRIPASRYTPNDDSGIPTGEVRAVACSAMDFRDWRHLGAARDRAEVERVTRGGGFDHSLIVDGSGMREFCQLRGSRGTTLRILSDQPALQVYGGDHFDGTQIGTSGVGYVRRAGIALETQGYPDAPNNPHFPSAVLRPGETYQTTTAWLVSPMENNPRPDAESTENVPRASRPTRSFKWTCLGPRGPASSCTGQEHSGSLVAGWTRSVARRRQASESPDVPEWFRATPRSASRPTRQVPSRKVGGIGSPTLGVCVAGREGGV